MKKTLFHIGMLAAAALAFFGCQKETEVNNQTEVTHVATITLNKADDTKTAVVEGQSSASYVWTEGDKDYLHVYENGVEGTVTAMNLSANNTVATLTVSFTGTPSAPYTYTAKYFSAESSSSHNPLVLAEQNPKANSFDPAADIMISKEISSIDSRLSELQFTMGRVVSVNKMTLTGLEEGEKVSKVEFTLDKHLVAYYVQESGSYSSNGTKLTLKYVETPITVPASGEVPVFFVCAPVENAAIKSVVVTTDKNVYTKSDQLDPNPFDGKTISFAVGTMKRFSMGMATYGEPIGDSVKYYEVTSEEEIADGVYILLPRPKRLVMLLR